MGRKERLTMIQSIIEKPERFHAVDNKLIDKCTDRTYTIQNHEEATELALLLNEQEMFIDFFKEEKNYLHELLKKEEKLSKILIKKTEKLEELLMLRKLQKL